MLESLLAAVRDHVALFDRGGRYLYVNPALAQVIGRPAEEVRGRTWRELDLPAETMAPIEAEIDRVFATGETLASGSRDCATSNGVKVFEYSLTPVVDSQGSVSAVAAVSRDVTELRLADSALLAASAEAERANRAKTRFLAAASHDLRQPVQAMRLLSHVLMQRLTDPDTLDIAAKLVQALDASDELLNALLDISSLEAGIVRPEMRSFALGPCLSRLVGEVEPQALAKGLALRCYLPDVEVESDPVLLDRMLRNLLGNAIRYTRRGGVLIGARRRGAVVRIEVWDTGPGIPADQLQAVFEDFHQLDNPERDRTRGLGLGLSIVQRMGRLLGHPVTVASRLGRGSVFAVEVPMSRRKAAAHPVAAGDPEPGESGEGAAVVVIEDDPAQLTGLEMLLLAWGYRAVCARAVDQACADLAARRIVPDVVVSDFRLSGGGTGIDAINTVRAAVGRPVPGIVVTGDTDPLRLREAKESGFRLLHKPYAPEELRSVIAAVLGGSGPSGPRAA